MKKAVCFTICFDEGLNYILCPKQIDAHALSFIKIHGKYKGIISAPLSWDMGFLKHISRVRL